MKIGDNIKKYRQLAKLSQTGLAGRCGWEESQGRVSHYETGRREPTLADLNLIAKACGVTLMQMIEGVDDSVAAQIAQRLAGVDPKYHKTLLEQLETSIQLIKAN